MAIPKEFKVLKERFTPVLYWMEDHFRLVLAAGISLLTLAVTAAILGNAFYKRMENQQLAKKENRQKRDYEYKLQQTLVQVSRNLIIGQFLGAYKVITAIPPPKFEDAYLRSEYITTLRRIGTGLLTTQKLDEAEQIFRQIRNYEVTDQESERGLNFILSERSYAIAHRGIEKSAEYRKKENWSDTLKELQTARMNLEQVRNLRFRNVDEELRSLGQQISETRVQLLTKEAIQFTEKAISKAKIHDYIRANEALYEAERRLIDSQDEVYDNPVSRIGVEKLSRAKIIIDRMAPAMASTWNRMEGGPDQESKYNYFNIKGVQVRFKENRRIEVEAVFACNPHFQGKMRILGSGQKGLFWSDGVTIPARTSSPLKREFQLPEGISRNDIRLIEFKIYDERELYLSRFTYHPKQ